MSIFTQTELVRDEDDEKHEELPSTPTTKGNNGRKSKKRSEYTRNQMDKYPKERNSKRNLTMDHFFNSKK